ncbi:MAG TPA: hypothetical protein VGD15_24665, partial [Kribbella sp.]
FVIDYLADEVLARQPAQVRDFLLGTAVLARLTGPLCDAVTGRGDGATMLEELERGNLFLVPLDTKRSWYRYHHLFADVLHARLLAEQPELVRALHERASAWFNSRGLTEDAVRHALAAEDFDRAAYLMEEALPELRRTRQDGVLLAWARSLPESVIRRSPVLSILSASSLLMSGDIDAVESRLDDADAALASGARDPETAAAWADTDDVRTAPATVSVFRAALAQARGDVAGTVRHAQRAMDLAGPEDHFVRGGAGGFLGLAAWAAGDVQEALSTFGEAVHSLHAAGNLVDEMDGTRVLADLHVAAGRPGRARRLYEQALQSATGAVSRTRGPPPTCTSAWPSSTESSTTCRAPRRTLRGPECSVSEPPLPRTGTGGSWPWHNCAPPPATTTPRQACSTRRRRSTGTGSTPTYAPSPRRRPASRLPQETWTRRPDGPTTEASASMTTPTTCASTST